MTRDLIETAVREGVPFTIKMADGHSYEVRDRDKIMVGKAHVVIMDEKLLPHVLPMLTITGLSYQEEK
jgi:hypothetical protein